MKQREAWGGTVPVPSQVRRQPSVRPFCTLPLLCCAVLCCAALQVDLNVSLTAISLLWNAADMLGRSVSSAHLGAAAAAAAAGGEGGDESAAGALAEGEASEGPDGAAAGRKAQRLGGRFGPAETEEMLQLVFGALQVRATERSEVLFCRTCVQLIGAWLLGLSWVGSKGQGAGQRLHWF